MVVNGEFVPNSDLTVTDANGDRTTARTGDVMEITVDNTDTEYIQNGDNRVYLTINSDEEVYEFGTN
jgi:archaellum component FlaG (FlaF/FlaG flagellin family)